MEAAAGTIQGDQQPPPAGQTDRQLASAGDKLASAGDKCNLKKQRVTDSGSSSSYMEYPDLLEGSGFVLEGLEEKGLDAKSYIQTMLRRTEGSSKEEQIYQKEQILAELQRVEKELQPS